MHLSPCLHPRIVRNRFTGEKIMIPCGKCDACCNLRTYMWSQKLVDESINWRYMIFFTLTYDENNCPLLFKSGKNKLNSLFRERNIKLSDGKFHSFLIDDRFTVALPSANNDFESKYYRSRKFYPYVRFKDIQQFIKRLRSRIDYYDKAENKDLKKIIYFIASEYGSQSLRSHYHGIIFTNSQWVASNFRGLLSASWLFGNKDFSFARSAEKSASYVAKYCCKSSDIPAIYDDPQIKQFYTFSRSFSFGSCILSDSQVLEVFNEASPTVPRYDFKNSCFVDVPLYKSIENRLFPRIRGFDKLSVSSRNQLYGIWQSFSYCSFKRFKTVCKRLVFKPRPLLNWTYDCLDYKHCLNAETLDYIKRCLLLDRDNASRGKDNDNNLKSLYYCSRKIVSFCVNRSVSLYYYVSQIDKYYKNKDAYRLNNQLQFEQEYSKFHPLSDLVWLFPAIVDELNNGICVSVDAFDYYFSKKYFNFVPLQQTFDWQISALSSSELRKNALKSEAVNESFDYSRFKTTMYLFEIID